VTGGDFTWSNLALARGHYGGRVPLVRLDAGALPFRKDSFDTVILFETLYYLKRPARFVAECARVLRGGGILLIGTVNPEWRGFHPSPLAQRYFSARELDELLSAGGFRTEIFGGFRESSPRGRLLSRVKRIAGRAGLIPATLRGREAFKRLVFGPLRALPAEIEPNGYADQPLEPIVAREPQRDYTILYALGRLPAARCRDGDCRDGDCHRAPAAFGPNA
jgi:SAM-dependent methyltransferase